MKAYMGWGGVVLGLVLGVSTWHMTQGIPVYPQGWFVKGLLYTAWVRTQASGRQVKPWPGATTWPLARLSIPRLNTEQIVLARVNEGSPFALAHLQSSVLPGNVGNSVIGVHRDSYVSFLQSLKTGDVMMLESLHSGRWHYQVSAIYVVDKTDVRLLEPSLNRRLTFISCYACTDVQDPRRYVVVAEEIERGA